jgi:hypothetical protein
MTLTLRALLDSDLSYDRASDMLGQNSRRRILFFLVRTRLLFLPRANSYFTIRFVARIQLFLPCDVQVDRRGAVCQCLSNEERISGVVFNQISFTSSRFGEAMLFIRL